MKILMSLNIFYCFPKCALVQQQFKAKKLYGKHNSLGFYCLSNTQHILFWSLMCTSGDHILIMKAADKLLIDTRCDSNETRYDVPETSCYITETNCASKGIWHHFRTRLISPHHFLNILLEKGPFCGATDFWTSCGCSHRS